MTRIRQLLASPGLPLAILGVFVLAGLWLEREATGEPRWVAKLPVVLLLVAYQAIRRRGAKS